MSKSNPTVADGHAMYDKARGRERSQPTTKSGVGRGRLAYLAKNAATPEGRDARAKLRAHFNNPKNDDGTDFAADHREDTDR